MNQPTADEIRSWSKLDFGTLGYADGSPDPLDELLARGAALFTEITGLKFGDTSITAEREPLVRQVIQRTVELMAVQSSQDIIETVGDFMLISSFSAGSYSESRRSLSELKDAKMIHADPTLNGLLWSLLTPDKYDWWMAYFTGENAPAWDVTEMAWGVQSTGYGDGPLGLDDSYGDWPKQGGVW